MKDEELKLEEIETSHTLGGAVIHTQIRQSLGRKQTMPVWVPITDTPPVYMRERGGGKYGLRITISVVIHT